MEKENEKKLVIEPEMVFEMKNTYLDDFPDDPTTSLATTTFTHVFTLREQHRKKDHR